MFALICFVLAVLVSSFKSRSRLEAENAVLRHQLNVLRRKVRGRVRLTNGDRWFFIRLYRWFPSILQVLTVIRPETLVRRHRTGFRSFWHWKSRSRGGRPPIETDLRVLIRRMSIENPLWGAPRIHGELLKLGFEVGQSTVVKYMAKRRGPPNRGWRTFLRNHASHTAAIDQLVVPTIGFKLLYAVVIMRLDRRRLVWTNATTNPTAGWIARQVTEAFPWDQAPRYLLRDRDRFYGGIRPSPIESHGLRDHPTAPRSPWQNGVLWSWAKSPCAAPSRRTLDTNNAVRTHRSLHKASPEARPIQFTGTARARRASPPLRSRLGFRYTQLKQGRTFRSQLMQRSDDNQSNPWRLVRRENKYDCSYFTVRCDIVTHRGGQPRPYNHLHKKNFGIAVVPIDNDGSTTLIGQYRYVLDRFTWEVTRGGGKCDAPPIDAARRELSEETGYSADHWLELFAASASPGTTDAIAPGFVAWGLHSGQPHPDPEELITQRRVPFSTAVSLALSGEIADLASIAAILAIETRFRRGELPPDLAKLLRISA